MCPTQPQHDRKRERWISRMAKNELKEIPNETLQELQRSITEDVQRMQSQLSDRNKTDQNGERVSEHEYHDWHKRLAKAHQHRLSELRAVKDELNNRNQKRHEKEEAQRPSNLVAALLAQEIGLDALELKPQELDTRVRDCIRAAETIADARMRIKATDRS